MSGWLFLPIGYTLSVLCETPVLYFGLSPHHSTRDRIFAGIWLTACTYPIVILALPSLTGAYYIWIAETFAPIAECLLFVWVFRGKWTWRDMVAIVAANLTSFLMGRALLGA
jgi:hypothetical protein